jgi:hypothetical protein
LFPYTGLIDEDWLSELIQQVLPTTTTIAPQEHPGLQQRGVAGVLMPMALLGPSARQQQSGNSRGGNFNDPAAMSAGLGMQAYHNAAAPTSHSQHAILAAAAAAAAAAAHNQGLTTATMEATINSQLRKLNRTDLLVTALSESSGKCSSLC